MTLKFLSPTSALFAQMVNLRPGERVLLLHADDGALARWAVQTAGKAVLAFPPSYRTFNALSQVSGLEVSESVYPDSSQHGPADIVLLNIPKGREHAQAYIWTAAETLRPGGRLYLAGPNDGGAKTAIKDAALVFGKAPTLGYKSSHRIAIATRPEQLTLPEGWSTSWQSQTRLFSRPEGDFTIVTMPGVFSWDHLDDGTALMLDHLDIEPKSKVLDIGCGYGIIGLAAARAGAHVTMVDDDLLAVRCARASAEINQIPCMVLPSDVTSAVSDQRYDLVLSNPPFHYGMEINTALAQRIVRDAFGVLRRGGKLRVVANRFLTYDHAMRDTFGNVRTLADNRRYRILEAVRTT